MASKAGRFKPLTRQQQWKMEDDEAEQLGSPDDDDDAQEEEEEEEEEKGGRRRKEVVLGRARHDSNSRWHSEDGEMGDKPKAKTKRKTTKPKKKKKKKRDGSSRSLPGHSNDHDDEDEDDDDDMGPSPSSPQLKTACEIDDGGEEGLDALTFSVYVLTWNLKKKMVNLAQLSEVILGSAVDVNIKGRPDIYVIGAQELPPGGLHQSLSQILGDSYCQVAASSLITLQVSLYVRQEIKPLISDVEIDGVPTGYGFILGNKGGVGIQIMLQGARMLFITCHLSAHQDCTEERNEDYRKISSGIFFPERLAGTMKRPGAHLPFEANLNSFLHPANMVVADCWMLCCVGDRAGDQSMPAIEEEGKARPPRVPTHGWGEAPKTSSSSVKRTPKRAATGTTAATASYFGSRSLSAPTGPGTEEEFYDLVIWSGDLNYRVEGNRQSADVVIQKRMIEVLKANDQLTREMRAGHVFQGYKEGPINFLPTYKYDSDSDNYDTTPKARVPSWTDRILYKVKSNGCVAAKLLKYDSINSVKISDHRPVFAIFKVKVYPSKKIQMEPSVLLPEAYSGYKSSSRKDGFGIVEDVKNSEDRRLLVGASERGKQASERRGMGAQAADTSIAEPSARRQGGHEVGTQEAVGSSSRTCNLQ